MDAAYMYNYVSSLLWFSITSLGRQCIWGLRANKLSFKDKRQFSMALGSQRTLELNS